MPKIYGLGKGLGSLIPSKILEKDFSESLIFKKEERIFQIPVNKIKTNPHQPRKDFDRAGLEELTDSIREHGILQPLIATETEGGYVLIAGERRLRAAQFLGLKTVPAIIRKIKEHQYLELALIENVQRKNLNPLEEAWAFKRLTDEFNLTQEEVAKRAGKSRAVVANTLRLLGLAEEIKKAVLSEKINYSAARLLAGLPEKEALKLFKKILKNDLTVKAAEGQVKKVVVKRHLRKIKNPNLAAQEEALSEVLGTKVTIKKSGKFGQIIIEFYSAEDLAGLIEKIVA